MWTNVGKLHLPPVNIYDKVSFDNLNEVKNTDFPIQINHYFSRTYNEYLNKISRGDAFFKINPRNEEYFYEHEINNTAVDYSAYRYLIKLKLMTKKGKDSND